MKNLILRILTIFTGVILSFWVLLTLAFLVEGPFEIHGYIVTLKYFGFSAIFLITFVLTIYSLKLLFFKLWKTQA